MNTAVSESYKIYKGEEKDPLIILLNKQRKIFIKNHET